MAGLFGYTDGMPIVRMLWDLQGGRYDGQPWPGFHGLIEVPEAEAEDMVASGIAEYADAPLLDRGYDVLKAPSLEYEDKLKFADGTPRDEDELFHSDGHRDPHATGLIDEDEDPWDDDDDFDRDESEPVIPPLSCPATTDNKAAWVAYAFEQGDLEADTKTKAQLVAKHKSQ